jgi:hypothetical protein
VAKATAAAPGGRRHVAKMKVVVAIAKERGGRRLLHLHEIWRVATFQAGRIAGPIVGGVVGLGIGSVKEALGAAGVNEMTLDAAVLCHHSVSAKLSFERSGFEIARGEPPLMRGLKRIGVT